MGRNIAGQRKWEHLGILETSDFCHLGPGPFLPPLPGPWGQGRGGPEIWDLDTLSYPSRGKDFSSNLVHDFAD